MNERETKQKQELQKPQLQLVPRVFVEAVARRLELGARQRGAWNWRRGEPLSASTYAGKMLRHLYAWIDGEVEDAEGGSHLAALAADVAIVLDALAHGQLVSGGLPGGAVAPVKDEGPKPESLPLWSVWRRKVGAGIEYSAVEYPEHGTPLPPTSDKAWECIGNVWERDAAAAVTRWRCGEVQP